MSAHGSIRLTPTWLFVVAATLTGCRGPTDGEFVSAFLGAVPIVIAITAVVLRIFEFAWGIPSRPKQWRRVGVMLVLSVPVGALALVEVSGGVIWLPFAVILYGAPCVSLSMLVWRVALFRRRRSWFVVATGAGVLHALPALSLLHGMAWADSLILYWYVAGGALYAPPILTGLLSFESLVRLGARIGRWCKRRKEGRQPIS